MGELQRVPSALWKENFYAQNKILLLFSLGMSSQLQNCSDNFVITLIVPEGSTVPLQNRWRCIFRTIPLCYNSGFGKNDFFCCNRRRKIWPVLNAFENCIPELGSEPSQIQTTFHMLQWPWGFQQLAGSGFHSSSSFMMAVILCVSICTCLQCMTLVIHLKSPSTGRSEL